VGGTAGVSEKGARVLSGLGARVGFGWRERRGEGCMVGKGAVVTGATEGEPPCIDEKETHAEERVSERIRIPNGVLQVRMDPKDWSRCLYDRSVGAGG